MKKINRRTFLRKSSVAALCGFSVPYLVPARVLGADNSIAPSNRITIGCIGTGGQGFYDMPGFLNQKDVQLIAVCDVNRESKGYLGEFDGKWTAGVAGREPARRFVEKFYAQKNHSSSYTGCTAYADFRDLLARPDIDAVITALPDHWHALVAIAAARAGKDVYGEKPLAYTIAEGRAICHAVKQYNTVWQTGSQQRSSRNFRYACELVRNGWLGQVHTVKVGLGSGFSTGSNGIASNDTQPAPVPDGFDYDMWLGPAPETPFSWGRCFWNFRWISDYAGGAITDWAGHHCDIAQWAMGTDHTGPVEIEGTGQFPDGSGNLYDTLEKYHFACKFAQGFDLIVSNDFDSGIRFEGTDGWLFINRSKLIAEPASLLSSIIKPDEIHLYESSNHIRNFLDCVRTRSETIAPAEVGLRSISIGLLGIIAIKMGQKLNWDPAKEIFTNCPAANRLLSRPMRSPWHL